MSNRQTLAAATAQVMVEQGQKIVWLGNVTLWENAYARRYGIGSGVRLSNNHPMNRAQAVFDACRRSRLFQHAGYIRSGGFSARETLHPVFRLRGA